MRPGPARLRRPARPFRRPARPRRPRPRRPARPSARPALAAAHLPPPYPRPPPSFAGTALADLAVGLILLAASCLCSAPASSSLSSCSTPSSAGPRRPGREDGQRWWREAAAGEVGAGKRGSGSMGLASQTSPPIWLAQRLPGHARGRRPDLRAPEQQRLHCSHRAAHREQSPQHLGVGSEPVMTPGSPRGHG